MKKQQGFSLIELMIVIAVIGVLTAVAIPQYQNYVQKSELGAALASVTALKINVEDKIATDGAFPTIANSDMSSELGATNTILGTMETKQSAGAAGQIILTLSGKTQNSTKKIALERDANGEWICLTDLTATAIFPKGCNTGTIL
ncbi:pilin [Grimontia hollisae]|uniref:pilin n=1 Tax=Grimontia hollisae TaxID=673 RepID=UPI001303D7E6|nr:pilin [Grimontia hollisae]